MTMTDETNDLILRLRGRAAFLRKRGLHKSADLMAQAADELERRHNAELDARAKRVVA